MNPSVFNINPLKNMKMKRQIISWGMMLVAAFTLTNCAKEIENPNQEPESVGYPFEIVASAVDTKTTNADFATEWTAGDQINLFHAVTGANDDYINNNAFTIAAEDLADGRFTGELAAALVSGTSYDWYAFYPYKTYITTPAVQTSGWTYIGGRSDTPQEQTGVNSMAHIAGDNYPLCGRILNVAYDVKPELTMSHASALLEVKVTNTLETELTVTSISFTALDNTSLVGQFYPCITGDEVTYTDGQYVSNVANLSVAGATVAAGESASFYLAVKPFTAANGTELKITVNEADESTIKMTKDVKFSAGKIKTLNFAYDKVEEPAPEGVTEVEIVSSELGIGNAFDVTSVNDGLLVFDQGTNSNNAPKYYSSGEAIRMYTGNTLTVTAPDGCILTGITFTFVTNYGSSLTCTNSTGYSNGTWKGELDKVVFNVSGSSQSRITKIVVTYVEGEVEAPEMTGIEVDNPKLEYFKDTEFVQPVVNAIYSNGIVEPIEGAEFTGYDLSTVGTQTVYVTYGDFSTSYTITVSEPAGEQYVLFAGELVEGDYIIVYDGGAMKSVVSSSRLSYSDVEIVDDTIYQPDEDIVWHIAKSGDYWTIYNESVDKYAAGTGAKNKAQLLASGTDTKSLWTASGTGTYEFVNKGNADAGVNKNLRRNGTYGFACYSTSTGGALTLYKKN